MNRIHHHRPFGNDAFGRVAERVASFFATPQYLIGQTLIVLAWLAFNGVGSGTFDPYPFILLNLIFSTQASYAAPLILLAQTRQAARDKAQAELDAEHREEIAARHTQLMATILDLVAADKALTERVETLAAELHNHIIGDAHASESVRPTE